MTFVMGGNSHAGSRKFWILCSSQEEFPKISFLISFFCFHPISDLLQWPVSVYKAPAPSPRQAAQAAQLHQELQQEGTATGEVLELSNTFPLRRLSLQQHSCAAAQLSASFLNLLF